MNDSQSMIIRFLESFHPETDTERKVYYFGTPYLRMPSEDAIEVCIIKKYTMKEIEEWSGSEELKPEPFA
jgi:hypothetical protein